MYLRKLYSDPEGLFPSTTFGDGMRFIYAKKDQPSDTKKSLNGVGKSLFVNLVDYCLLSSISPHIKSVIKNNDLLKERVVLEFEVNDTNYIIKRSLIDGNKDILFGKVGEELKSYQNTQTDKVLSKILCDLIFRRENYSGIYSSDWLRQLMPFYIKKQSEATKVNFIDPINYLQGTSELELIPLHLFLLGINNSVFLENLEIKKKIKDLKPAIKQVVLLVKNQYGVSDVNEAENTIQKLQQQVVRFEQNIKNYELADQYADVENNANKITRQIKTLLFKNISDKNKVSIYEESYQYKDNIDTKSIEKIYRQYDEMLAGKIKKTLDEALEFRKSISKSREEFLREEIISLRKKIEERTKLISDYERGRASLLTLLNSKEAITDITEAYLELSRKRDNYSDLKSKIKTLSDLNKEMARFETVSSNLYEDILKVSEEIDSKLQSFREVFFKLHDEIYTEFQGEASLLFKPNSEKDSRIDFDISLPKRLSKGKNQARTLLYDLSVLLYSIQENISLPRFLIHDGVFDGMDRAHFIHLFQFLDKQKKMGKKFQYIVTLNQEGTVKDVDFGVGAEEITSTKIEELADVILTPSSPLFGKHWN